MFNLKDRKFLLTIAGFIWGLSGFTVELVSSGAKQKALYIRLVFVLLSNVIILLFYNSKIRKEYFTTLILILLYIVFFNLSVVIHNAHINHILRESLLLITCITVILVLYEKEATQNLLNGIYYALTILVLFYFFHIDFAHFFSLLYRLQTNLNPNGIGTMAVMLFLLSLHSFYYKHNKKIRIAHLFIGLIALVVILATRSRTALVMAVFAFIVINYYRGNLKSIFITLLIITTLILSNFEDFNNIIRLTTPESYSGKKNIANLTGRTDVWKKGFEIIKDNFLFGIGPDRAVSEAPHNLGSFHNAYIQLLITVGFVGFSTLLLLLVIAFSKLLIRNENILFKSIFLVGFIGSLAENRLLNFGSPGNLLFLISFLYLSRMNIPPKFKQYKKILN